MACFLPEVILFLAVILGNCIEARFAVHFHGNVTVWVLSWHFAFDPAFLSFVSVGHGIALRL